MNMEKMKEVFSEEAFVKALFEMESVAEMQEALREKSVLMSDEEITALHTFFAKVKSGEISREQLAQWSQLAENGELSEEMLEQVAGGLASMFICFGVILAIGGLAIWGLASQME